MSDLIRLFPSSRPHPEFPVGCRVRVRPLRHTARPGRLALAGRVGVVARSANDRLFVDFTGPTGAVRMDFPPGQLERVGGGGGGPDRAA